MITKWKVFNFKSIQKETELSFAPLTILAGANSSGKSTVLQSILLISQTLSHKIGSRSVVLNGTLLQLGEFNDLRSFDGEADQIAIGWECKPTVRSDSRAKRRSEALFLYGPGVDFIKEVACEISFDADPSSPRHDVIQLQPALFSSQLSVLARTDEELDSSSNITVTRAGAALVDEKSKISGIDLNEVPTEAMRAGLQYDVQLDEQSLAEIREDWKSANPVGCLLRHFLPVQLLAKINTLEEQANLITSALAAVPLRGYRRLPRIHRDIILTKKILDGLRSIMGEKLDWVLEPGVKQSYLFEEDLGGLSLLEWADRVRQLPPDKRHEIRKLLQDNSELYQIVFNALQASKGEEEEFALVSPRLPVELMSAVRYLDDFFSNRVKYLGPLRDEPKALYPLAASSEPSDLGLRGELTAAVLDLHKNKQVRYIPSFAFDSGAIEKRSAVRTLESAVADWLQYLGVAESAKSRDRGKLGHELKVRLNTQGPEHDLTHVGVGVSQVLPILVMCLLADQDTTLIFEQPELHLHPRVQTRLADFFLSISFMGKQCIIETHSEYLINRLRYRAACEEDGRVTENLKIYFVEMEDGHSMFREVHVNEYGAIQDWPEGFFDQSQTEAENILRAAAMKRKTKREK